MRWAITVISIAAMILSASGAGARAANFGPARVLASGFPFPDGLAVNGAGDVFVSDVGNSTTPEEIYEITPSGTQTILDSVYQFWDGEFVNPGPITLDPSGNLDVASTGVLCDPCPPGGIPASGCPGSPADSCTDPIFQFHVSDTGTYDETDVSQFGGYVDAPQGITSDTAGDIFVSTGDTVQEYTAPGYAESTLTGFSFAQGVAVDQANDLFVAEFGRDVVEVTPSGARTTVGSNIVDPSALAVDKQGDLFVGDHAGSTGSMDSNQIVEITPSGSQQTIMTGLGNVAAMGFDAAGDLFVADDVADDVLELPLQTGASRSKTTVSCSKPTAAQRRTLAAGGTIALGCNARVRANAPGSTQPTGSVNFTAAPAPAAQPASCELPGTAPDHCRTTLSIDSPGTYRVVAEYNGDPVYATSHTHTTLPVK